MLQTSREQIWTLMYFEPFDAHEYQTINMKATYIKQSGGHKFKKYQFRILYRSVSFHSHLCVIIFDSQMEEGKL